jgi:hypothetical protein
MDCRFYTPATIAFIGMRTRRHGVAFEKFDAVASASLGLVEGFVRQAEEFLCIERVAFGANGDPKTSSDRNLAGVCRANQARVLLERECRTSRRSSAPVSTWIQLHPQRRTPFTPSASTDRQEGKN